MARLLITSGPTREYLDPVRYLTNASSGRMGCALCGAALAAGFDVTVVTGPVELDYPKAARVVRVVSTAEMRDATLAVFPNCAGGIGVAAPCDFTPVVRSPVKMTKDQFIGGAEKTFSLELTETPDILAALGVIKRADQWLVAFALETHDHYARARKKLAQKNADLIVLNRPNAIGVETTSVELLDAASVLESFSGDKSSVAQKILAAILRRFQNPS